MIAVSRNEFKHGRENFKIESFLKQVIRLVQMQHDMENVRLHFNISTNTPERMIGD
jgi:hypothetical protein